MSNNNDDSENVTELKTLDQWKDIIAEEGIKVLDPDGFRGQSMSRLYSREELDQRLMSCTIRKTV